MGRKIARAFFRVQVCQKKKQIVISTRLKLNSSFRNQGRHTVFYPTLYSIEQRVRLAAKLGTLISMNFFLHF